MAGSTIELTEESTHEDIQAAVDQIIAAATDEDVSQETKPEEPESVSNGVEAENEGNETVDDREKDVSGENESGGEVDSGSGWLTDDVKAEVSAYGIEEEDLSEFASREELDRALRFIDKRAMKVGKEAGKTEEQARDENGKFIANDKTDQPDRQAEFQIELSEEDYDEDLIGQFTKMRDHYESRLQAMETRFVHDEAVAEEQRFDGFVDSLDHKEWFGATGEESDAQMERRKQLYEAVQVQQLGMAQMGRKIAVDESLVSRVAGMVFADEFNKKTLKARSRRSSIQSNRRQGGGLSRPVDPQESPREFARQLYKELDNS